MTRNQAAGTINEIELTETGVTYSPVFNFSGYNSARQLEVKVDVTAGDGSIDFEVEASDDGVEYFTVEDTEFTIAAVAKKGIFFDVVGKFMRVKMDYTHAAVDTELTMYNLVR